MAKLSKKILIDELQEQLAEVGIKLNKEDTKLVFSAYAKMVEEAVLNVHDGDYDSFGLDWSTVKFSDVEAKTGVSALTGKEWSTPAHKVARIKISTPLKDALKANTTK